ncbi:MAG TPA: hypothetical protein VH436_15430 [Vicinamibacterales bacterium]
MSILLKFTPTLHWPARVQTWMVDPFVVALSRRCTLIWGWWQTGHSGARGGRSFSFGCMIISVLYGLAIDAVNVRLGGRRSANLL